MRLPRILLNLAVLVATVLALTSVPSDAARVQVVVYPDAGRTVRSGETSRLTGTPLGFRRFVQRQLNLLWQATGSEAGCRDAGYVTIKRWRSDGFASAPAVGLGQPCPGGGGHQIYVRRNGAWQAPWALGGQDLLYCSDLRSFAVPWSIAGRSCYSDLGVLRRYRSYRLPPAFHSPRYAALLLVASVERYQSRGADRWAAPSTVGRLFDMQADGADLTIRDCFGRRDPRARYLGAAKVGCVVDAFYGDYRSLSVLRLYPASIKRFKGGALVRYAST